MKYKIVLLAIVTFALLAVRPSTNQLKATSGIYSDSLHFTATDFSFVAEGTASIYTSPPLQSPLPFNVLFSSWTMEGDADNFGLYIRTSKTGENWSDWQHIAINDDWTRPQDPDVVGDIVLVANEDKTHNYLQYRLEISDPTASISDLLFTVIDSTAGPTAEEMLAQQAALDAKTVPSPTDGYPKPSVVSREVWCLADACDYDPSTLYYSTTTHLIIHHTAGSNYDLDYDWPSIVRAIWNYHTFTRGWGDIGYNYLVDPNGVLYEGHLGGDDVKGVHASGANSGSMALSFMGNFTTLTPYDAMLNSAIELFAWKADQRNINVFDAGPMPFLDWGLPTLSGHRDVYGGTNTECPGEKLHELIPLLQNEVAATIGFVDPAVYAEETSTAFAMSDPAISWYDSPNGCGHLRHGYYTFSVTEPADSTNWGEWTLSVPTNGRYQLDAYVPYCTTGRLETDGATYDIDHAGGHSTVTVSQQDGLGLWISLGEYEFTATEGGLVRLTDLTDTDTGLGVWFDSLRLIKVADAGTTAVNLTPADSSWTTVQTVNLGWALTHPENIITSTVQVATDVGFTDMITETVWQTAVSSHTIPFTQDYAAIHWRVQFDLSSGEQITSTPTVFGIDSTPPTSTISSLSQPDDVSYIIALEGVDALVGVGSYAVDYRQAGATAWTSLISGTAASTISVTLPLIDQPYEFRSQAVDLLGNVEPPHDQPDAVSTVPIVATAVNLTPADNSWMTDRAVNFEWALTHPENIVTVTLQAATDVGFTNMITETVWQTAVSSHTLPFTQDYAAIHWRIQLTLTDGTPFTSAPAQFGIDSTPPTSTVASLHQFNSGDYLINVSGADALAGIDSYTVEYRELGETAWTTLITDTAGIGIRFSPPVISQTYEFRTQAVDLLGNIEPPHALPDAVSTNAILLAHEVFLPIIIRR